MKDKATYIVSGLIILVGGYFIYNKFYKKTTRTKEENINLIVSSKNHANKENILDTFEDDFLIAWATAIEKGQELFNYKGNTYEKQGGKRKK
jgi:putative Mn2+ efflux pump MntP